MYIPRINRMDDDKEAVAFMQRYSFATLITSEKERPEATHLPVIVEENSGEILLKSHFAKANQQWENIDAKEVLVIFTEPHAYVSPKNYEKTLNVPTWNYISIHAYGKCTIIEDYDEVIKLLEKTINYYEEAYGAQWESLPEDYKRRMCKGIVAFQIEVTELQSKKKLSQNKSEVEQNNIINDLSKSSDTNEVQIAEYMKNELK